MKNKFYSNEIVFRGHPDKVCDQIAGAILDEYLRRDPNVRAGIEVVGGYKSMMITGEITSKVTPHDIDVTGIAIETMKRIGTWDAINGEEGYSIYNEINYQQSPDIAQGVDKGGAGDQGMMFGYACDDTPEMLPLAQVILQELAIGYDKLSHKHPETYKPDGKAQITGAYDENMKLQYIRDFTISYQNHDGSDGKIKTMAKSICAKHGIKVQFWHINPTGKFERGGFEADSGLTGRKIVVDAYQSFANVGGGSMNGKDPTKVDISAAYKARDIACRMLKKRGLHWCEVQLSYAIGIAEPLAIYIDSDKGIINDEGNVTLHECTPSAMIEDLKLREPQYEERAKFGHFRRA